MARIAGKVCLVTGAAGAIGQEIVRLFAAEGGVVVGTDLREPPEGDAKFLIQDVTDEARWTEVVSTVVARHGRLDVLVNNAGWEGPAHNALTDVTIEEWRRVQAINVEGTFLGCRAAMPVMQNQGGGSIINLSSIAAICATPQQISYGVSKAAVKQLTSSVSKTGLSHGVRCNAIHPGQMDTQMLRNIYLNVAATSGVPLDEVERKARSAIPVGRLGSPRDVAYGALYLASDESSYVTGSSLMIDGGMSVI